MAAYVSVKGRHGRHLGIIGNGTPSINEYLLNSIFKFHPDPI